MGGRALCDDGLVIDLSRMNSVFVDAAREAGYTFKGRKKADAEDAYDDEFVDCVDDNGAILDSDLQLVAGTAWRRRRNSV